MYNGVLLGFVIISGRLMPNHKFFHSLVPALALDFFHPPYPYTHHTVTHCNVTKLQGTHHTVAHYSVITLHAIDTHHTVYIQTLQCNYTAISVVPLDTEILKCDFKKLERYFASHI